MIRYFQKRFALSRKGAKDLAESAAWSTLLNIGFMLPAVFTFLFLEDYLSRSSASHGLPFYLALAAAFMTIIFIIAYIQYRSTYTKIYSESAERRIGMAEKLRTLPLAFFGDKNLSDLTSAIMEDCTTLEQVFSHSIPQLLASIASMCIIAAGLLFYNWQLSLALLWVVPVAIIVIILSKKSVNKSFIDNYHIKRAVSEQIQEGMETIHEIKAYNGEEQFMGRFGNLLKDYEKSLIKGEMMGVTGLNASYMILKLGLVSVIIAGAKLLDNGSIDLFTYLVFIMIGSSIYNPVMEIFNNMVILQFLDVRIKRIRELNDMPEQEGKNSCEVKHFDISFKNVNFSYEAGKQVLKDVSFTARQGEVTALVGPSGGGKSTAAKLAARFWDIDGGKILLGNQDISKVAPETLLKNFAIVFQDVLLFNASVADNIRIGKPDAGDEEIRRVAALAQCDEFIRELPDGYDTIIGENGASLSGGERQRISIARALLKDAPVVLLDEATASLDVENETRIQAGISELIKNKTVLIIAHRMRTVAKAHKVVVIKEGKVVECGSPEALLAQKGEFARMYETQKNTAADSLT